MNSIMNDFKSNWNIYWKINPNISQFSDDDTYSERFEKGGAKDHPSRMSVRGLVLNGIGAALAPFPYLNTLSVPILTYAALHDKRDGVVARAYKLYSAEGAVVDPLCDKGGHIPMALVMATHAASTGNLGIPTTVALNFIGHYITTRIRDEIKPQCETVKRVYKDPFSQKLVPKPKTAANNFGKVKAATQAVTNIVYSAYMAASDLGLFGNYQDDIDNFIGYSVASALTFCAISTGLNISSRAREHGLEDTLGFIKDDYNSTKIKVRSLINKIKEVI